MQKEARSMLRRLKMLKSSICFCILNTALIVVEIFFLSKAPYQYLPKKLSIAFLRLVVFEKMKKTHFAINR